MLENKRRDLSLSCDIAIVYLRTVIGVLANHLEYKMASWKERLSVFAAVASEVVASLVSRYEKAHPREK